MTVRSMSGDEDEPRACSRQFGSPYSLCRRDGWLCAGASAAARGQEKGVTELTSLPVPRHRVGPVAFSPSGKVLTLRDLGPKRFELWDLETRKVRSIACPVGTSDPLLGGVRFSSDGRLLAAEFVPGGIFVFELENLTERIRVPVAERLEPEIDAFGFLAGDRKLVVVRRARLSSGLLRSSSELRDVTTGKREAYHEYYPGVKFRTISPDARYILHTNGREQIVSESESGRRAFAVMELSHSCFSPDCTVLVSYDGEGFTRWGVPSGKKLGRVHVSVDQGFAGRIQSISLFRRATNWWPFLACCRGIPQRW